MTDQAQKPSLALEWVNQAGQHTEDPLFNMRLMRELTSVLDDNDGLVKALDGDDPHGVAPKVLGHFEDEGLKRALVSSLVRAREAVKGSSLEAIPAAAQS